MKLKEDLFTRRVEKIIPSEKDLESLLKTKKIRLYQGFDPTNSRLHLGHTVGLRKLMEFANLGHDVIFLFGTGTVLVGDPSLRETKRNLTTQKEIDKNIRNWKNQVEPIVDFNKIRILQNGDWLTKLTLKDIIKIASNISAIQLFKRQSFQRRLNKGDTVWYYETMYPLLQGYDSVVMDVDLEVGGSDQEFNMLIGRELQRKMNNREKFVLTVPMIAGTDGNPMSKTSGNCVWLDDNPEDMYGKLMRIKDDQIKPYMKLLTDISLEEIKNLQDTPLENKKRLAFDITSQFKGRNKALKAQESFEKIAQRHQAPDEIETFKYSKGTSFLFSVTSQAFPEKSNSEIKRVIKQGGLEWNGKKLTDPNQKIKIKGGEVLKFGKRQFKKVKITKT